jgi:hypothetical protein
MKMALFLFNQSYQKLIVFEDFVVDKIPFLVVKIGLNNELWTNAQQIGFVLVSIA